MFKQAIIAPSILSADFMNMQRAIEQLKSAGAKYIHVDVMDGHFVPNLTMGVAFTKQLRKITNLTLDVHLMVANPLEQLDWFLDAGADILTVHSEVLDEAGMKNAANRIHEAGAKACVAIKPKTNVDVVKPVIPSLDMVLVMSVEPGFSGQSYIAGSEQKVAEIVRMAKAAGTSPLLEVDGGINAKTAKLVAAAGADVLVCGNAVCAAKSPEAAIAEITSAANAAAALATNPVKGA